MAISVCAPAFAIKFLDDFAVSIRSRQTPPMPALIRAETDRNNLRNFKLLPRKIAPQIELDNYKPSENKLSAVRMRCKYLIQSRILFLRSHKGKHTLIAPPRHLQQVQESITTELSFLSKTFLPFILYCWVPYLD